MGGMVTSVDGQVRRADGSVIDGLYAAGACASNIAENGKNYASGTQLGEGSFFGCRADVTPRQPRRTDLLPPPQRGELGQRHGHSSSAFAGGFDVGDRAGTDHACASDTAWAIAVAGNSGRGGRPRSTGTGGQAVPECEQVRHCLSGFGHLRGADVGWTSDARGA